READLFLVVGKRIDYRLALGGPRLFPAGARFIQVDLHEEELGLNRRLDVAIHADARATLEALTAAAGPAAWPAKPWLERVRGLGAGARAAVVRDGRRGDGRVRVGGDAVRRRDAGLRRRRGDDRAAGRGAAGGRAGVRIGAAVLPEREDPRRAVAVHRLADR